MNRVNTSNRVTMADVARTAGVSVATVSKVVNNKDGISEARAQHVKDVIARLGYAASLGAQSLRSRNTGVLGMLVADFEPFSTELLKGASSAIKATDYELLAYSGKSDGSTKYGWERKHLARLSGTLIDGAVIVTPTGVETTFPVPIVAVDPHIETTQLPTVRCDSYAGAITATQYLIGLGHRRIGFLGGRTDLQSSKDREAGYRAALVDAGLDIDESLIGDGGYSSELTIGPATTLLSGPHPPTAIFAANDLSAIEVIKVAESLGLSVPHDLSVVGFDNIPEAALFHTPLTTMAQPLQEMGAIAMDMLVRLVAGQETETQVILDTTLVVRDSCGRPAHK